MKRIRIRLQSVSGKHMASLELPIPPKHSPLEGIKGLHEFPLADTDYRVLIDVVGDQDA